MAELLTDCEGYWMDSCILDDRLADTCWVEDLLCLGVVPKMRETITRYSFKISLTIVSNYFSRRVSIYSDLMYYSPYFLMK